MVMEAMGAAGRRVREPEDVQDALDWAVRTSEERRVPVMVEITCERETSATMSLSIDRINEYDPRRRPRVRRPLRRRRPRQGPSGG